MMRAKPVVPATGAAAFVVAFLLASPVLAGERLVVLGQQVTEIIAALGEGGRVVAADGYLDHVEGIGNSARLRGYRQRAAEPLLVYRPDRVVVLDDNQFPDLIRQLRALGLEVVVLAPARRPEEVPALIAAIGRLLDRTAAADVLAQAWSAEFAAASSTRAPASRPATVFVLAGGGRPTLVAGGGTTPGQLIELAGGRNVAARLDGFQIMGPEALLAAQPALVITNTDGLSVTRGQPVALSLPGLGESPAARLGHVYAAQEYFLNGFGLYTPQGVREFRALVEAVAGAGD